MAINPVTDTVDPVEVISLEKLQEAYDEIWRTQVYPMSTRGKPKADDILKKHFPFLKP